jgi:hypothetical protein
MATQSFFCKFWVCENSTYICARMAVTQWSAKIIKKTQFPSLRDYRYFANQ